MSTKKMIALIIVQVLLLAAIGLGILFAVRLGVEKLEPFFSGNTVEQNGMGVAHKPPSVISPNKIIAKKGWIAKMATVNFAALKHARMITKNAGM